MSLSVIDLGELTLASSTSAIELTITSAATLDASAGTNHARSITLAHLMAPPADKPLIRVSRLLTFTINLMIDQNVADSTGAQVLLRNFVHCLKSAQLWNQLELVPSNVEVTSDHASNAHGIVLGLTCLEGSPDDLRAPPHKLPIGDSALDMRVPDGIVTAELSAVNVELQLNRRFPANRECQNAQRLVQSDHDQLPSRTTTFEAHDRIMLDLSTDESLLEETGHDMSRQMSDLRQDSLFADERDVWSDLMSLDNDDALLQNTPMSSLGYSAQPGRNLADITASLNMLFAAVRFAITKSPVKLTQGVRIVASKSFRHLAEIAPAVWSPGCCRSLSSRAIFLPTIDHALHAVGFAHSLRNTLRQKMTEVRRRSGGGRHQPERLTGGHRVTTAAPPAVACRLWRTMQHSLLRNEDANRLRPLQEAAAGPGLDDEDLMGADWDFMNESRPERCSRADIQCADFFFDPLEDEDMLAAWEDGQLSECCSEEPSPGTDDTFRACNRGLVLDDFGFFAWTTIGSSELEPESMHAGPAVEMDWMSWEAQHAGDLLDF